MTVFRFGHVCSKLIISAKKALFEIDRESTEIFSVSLDAFLRWEEKRGGNALIRGFVLIQ